MAEDPTPAQEHLQVALDGVAALCAPLNGMALKEWYVITVHADGKGEEIMSRFSRPGAMPWTEMGMLTFASQQEEREWAEDDPLDDPDGTFT